MRYSLAHWDGLQPYSDEDTSRGNLILALLTGGEGNHNFHHAFPHDFRSGPSVFDWDPSKWIILGLYCLGLAGGLRRVHEEDVKEAEAYMAHRNQQGDQSSEGEQAEEWEGEVWGMDEVRRYKRDKPSSCVVLIRGFVVDVTGYLGEHPGGAALLRRYSVCLDHSDARDATWAFDGGLNIHSRAAKKRMRALRIAKYKA